MMLYQNIKKVCLDGLDMLNEEMPNVRRIKNG